jgi:hypothetical protein
MKTCATRCTQKELAMLAYWQQRGHDMRNNRPVPLQTETPPCFATDHPLLDAAIGLGIIVMALSGITFWVATAAKLL